jgi:hypothetical protein
LRSEVFGRYDLLAHPDLPESAHLLDRWSFGDPVEPVRYYVHRQANEGLRTHVSPAVLPYLGQEIRFFPDCLLGAIYLCFALELAEVTREPLKCGGCGHYFVPTHGRQRYCRPACRKRAYRRRSGVGSTGPTADPASH